MTNRTGVPNNSWILRLLFSCIPFQKQAEQNLEVDFLNLNCWHVWLILLLSPFLPLLWFCMMKHERKVNKWQVYKAGLDLDSAKHCVGFKAGPPVKFLLLKMSSWASSLALFLLKDGIASRKLVSLLLEYRANILWNKGVLFWNQDSLEETCDRNMEVAGGTT